MERLNHQRTMQQHHKLKRFVVDMSTTVSRNSNRTINGTVGKGGSGKGTGGSKFLSNSVPVQAIRETGLHFLKPTKPSNVKKLAYSTKTKGSRGTTPRSKRMKVASKVYDV